MNRPLARRAGPFLVALQSAEVRDLRLEPVEATTTR
jgi:hypothetical protein